MSMDRREFFARCGAAGLGGTLFPAALLAIASQGVQSAFAVPAPMPPLAALPPITADMLEAAANVAGLELTPEQRQMMLEGVRSDRDGLAAIRAMNLPNAVAPAVIFDPRPAGFSMPRPSSTGEVGGTDITGLDYRDEEQLAFASIGQLGKLMQLRKVSSVELTKLYLRRLRRYDPQLHFVITYMDDRALAQAAQADREIASGKVRGPLHGIPWGAKDLLAVKGYPTTWGAAGFQSQHFDEDATVVQRLDAVGAVLLAKLSLGALAQGDVWFGGRTRNPWNPKQGSSGSSAGSASAVSAGCVGFAIGSETLGSISSPCTRCGVTGFRPTFGFVPRTGAMALSWSMDKVGPIARSALDAAFVLATINGPDGRDLAVNAASFDFNAVHDIGKLRVGFIESAFAFPTQPPPDASAPKPEAEALSPAKQEEQRQQRQGALERRIYDKRYDRAALRCSAAWG